MSLPQETMLQLMAFADGELEGEDRARIETLVEQSSEARQVVEAMRSPVLGDWLGEELEARLVAADGIADAVMACVEKTSPATSAGGGVVRLAGSSGRRSARVQVVTGVLVAALALAAGVTLYVSSVGPDSERAKAPVASVESRSVDVQPPPSQSTAVAQGPSQGVEVDEVDSPSRGFSVYEIPVGSPTGAANAAGPSSVVILIDADPGAK